MTQQASLAPADGGFAVDKVRQLFGSMKSHDWHPQTWLRSPCVPPTLYEARPGNYYRSGVHSSSSAWGDDRAPYGERLGRAVFPFDGLLISVEDCTGHS
jgi:hypothetical protein